MSWLLSRTDIPGDLSGKTVLDVGTTNGAMAFEMERRGARRVVAVDIVDDNVFGFGQIRRLLGSSAEFVRANIYELPETLGGERFDLVLFWGVLYHLRHPLLALDRLRTLIRGIGYIETQVSDHSLTSPDHSQVQFLRGDALGGDPSNWFVPTIRALLDMCSSCGLEPTLLAAWPEDGPERAMVRVVPTPEDPEYLRLVEDRYGIPARPVSTRFLDW